MVHILGCRQAVRHQTLTLAFVGSNPAIPATLTVYGSLAQLVEQRPFKAWVQGSSPWRATKKADTHLGICFFDCPRDSNHLNATARWAVGRWERAPSPPYDLPQANRQRVPGEPLSPIERSPRRSRIPIASRRNVRYNSENATVRCQEVRRHEGNTQAHPRKDGQTASY